MNRTKFAKLFFLISLIMMGLMSATQAAEDRNKPTLIGQTPDFIFAPPGFDDNDNAQVILAGTFPSTCFKVGPAQFRVDPANHRILIHQSAYYYSSAWCLQVTVPYQQTLNLGILGSMQYDILADTKTGFEKMAELPISTSHSANPDDFLYAPVKDVFLKSGNPMDPPVLILRGDFSNTCMGIDEVKTFLRPNPGNVIEVLPVVRIADNACQNKAVPFEVEVPFKPGMSGKFLVHVRSLNGQAINLVVDL